jgi:DNA-binding ferritin-like protein (Dps family)
MLDIFKKIIGDFEDKKEWNAIEARSKQLPHDYLVVYNKIKQYFWSGAGPLDSSIDLFKGLLELFEEGVANGKPVLEITGSNVAAFCDELVQGEKTYAERLREKLNRDIMKELGRASDSE